MLNIESIEYKFFHYTLWYNTRWYPWLIKPHRNCTILRNLCKVYQCQSVHQAFMAPNVLCNSPLFWPDNFPNHLSCWILKVLNINFLLYILIQYKLIPMTDKTTPKLYESQKSQLGIAMSECITKHSWHLMYFAIACYFDQTIFLTIFHTVYWNHLLYIY